MFPEGWRSVGKVACILQDPLLLGVVGTPLLLQLMLCIVLLRMYLRLFASCIQRSASSGVPAAAVSSASVSTVVALSALDSRSG